MNENRSSIAFCRFSCVNAGRNSDTVNRLLALVRGTDTCLWTNGLSSLRRCDNTPRVESNATSHLWSAIDFNSPTSSHAGGYCRGRTHRSASGSLQELFVG